MSSGPSHPILVCRVPLIHPSRRKKSSSLSRLTYAGELGATVTALGDSAALLDVKQTDITTGSLDDSGSVGGGVVAVRQICQFRPFAKCNSSTNLMIPSSSQKELTRCGGGK